MNISGWLSLEIKGNYQRARLGRFYLDGVNGTEHSRAVTITDVDDGTVRIDVYRYVLGESIFGGAFFMRRRENYELAKEMADAILDVFSADDGNECWFVWKLYPNGEQEEWGSWFNRVHSMVVIARSEDIARGLASEHAGAEGADVWRDDKKVCCQRIGHSNVREDQLVTQDLRTP